MALSFQYRGSPASGQALRRVAILPGAWNPPTVAHLAMARAARNWADEVVLMLPRAFPHKPFEGATFEERLEMLQEVARSEPGLSVAVSEGGLYLEMAEETAASLGEGVSIGLVCGRDAAERIAGWDYGKPKVFEEMVARFPLLVAGRAGEYIPSPSLTGRIVPLVMEAALDHVSSTEIRRRIVSGEPWSHLVPAVIADRVAELYGGKNKHG